MNDELFRSLEGKSKHALWLELCDIVTRHPKEVAHLKVEAIMRAGIRKFTDEVRPAAPTCVQVLVKRLPCASSAKQVVTLNVHVTNSTAVGVQVGRLWTSLADYFIRQGMFEKARDIYEEGLTTVITVRDFSLIFDALTTFETSLLEARMQVTLGSCLHTASLSMLQTKPSRSGAC